MSGPSIRAFLSDARAARTPPASSSRNSTFSAPARSSASVFNSEVDRDSKFIHYRDRQLGSSWWSLSTAYSDNSDGRLGEFSLEHPFYALGSRWAGGVSLLDDQRTDSRYDLGEIVDQFATHEKFSTIYWGSSNGLVDGWARRLSIGLTYEDHAFEAVPDALAPPSLLPADRTLVYPWIGAEWVEDSFHTARNRDQIEKTEDYSLGWHARAQIGLRKLFVRLGSQCRDAGGQPVERHWS